MHGDRATAGSPCGASALQDQLLDTNNKLTNNRHLRATQLRGPPKAGVNLSACGWRHHQGCLLVQTCQLQRCSCRDRPGTTSGPTPPAAAATAVACGSGTGAALLGAMAAAGCWTGNSTSCRARCSDNVPAVQPCTARGLRSQTVSLHALTPWAARGVDGPTITGDL
jgi:hypothetical protein